MRLLRGAWMVLVGIKDALVLIFMILFFALLYALLTATPNPAIGGSGALHLNLTGTIVEQPEEPSIADLLSGRAADADREFRLRDVIRALETAAEDDRITAVALDLDGFRGGGQSAIAEVADAIQGVRDAGKPVIAYATAYGDDAYALAAHASEIWVHPMGGALVLGPGGSNLYFGDMLEEIGVTAHVFRVGTYKAAVEPYTRADQSPEAEEALQALADTLFEAWREDVERARPEARLERIIAAPADSIEAANGDLSLAAHRAEMVDHVGGRAAWAGRVAEIAGEDDDEDGPGFRAIPLDNWVAATPRRGGGNRIGVITVAGTIVDGEAPPGTAGGETIARLIERASDEHDFAAFVVRIDSPGGSALASERIRRAILDAAEAEGDVPVVVSMGSVAASGGYWVATAGDRILAEPSTITGSIGVFAIVPTFEGTLAELGIGTDGVATTPLSGEPDLLGGLSPEVERLFQAGTEDVYRRFLALVGRARNMTPERVDEIGQGRVWAGATARQIGLVDQFGSLDDAIAEAARLAEIEPEDASPLFIERPPSAIAQFVRGWTREEADASAGSDPWAMLVPEPRAVFARALAELRLLLDGPRIQARCLECPVELRPLPRNEAASLDAMLLGWLRG